MSEKRLPLDSIRHAKGLLKHNRDLNNSQDEPHDWPMSRSSESDYARTFESFIGSSLRRHFEARKKRGLSNVTLDLASDGWPFTTFFHDGALAVGLSDPSKERDNAARYKALDVDVIKGNLLDRSTWNGINDWLNQHDRHNFDQIFYRPGGGTHYIGMNQETRRPHDGILFSLFRRAYPKLAAHGELFATMDTMKDDGRFQTFENFAEWLNGIPGIHTDIAVNARNEIVLHVQKDETAPAELPDYPA